MFLIHLPAFYDGMEKEELCSTLSNPTKFPLVASVSLTPKEDGILWISTSIILLLGLLWSRSRVRISTLSLIKSILAATSRLNCISRGWCTSVLESSRLWNLYVLMIVALHSASPFLSKRKSLAVVIAERVPFFTVNNLSALGSQATLLL